VIGPGHDRANVAQRTSHRSRTRSLDLEDQAPFVEPGRGLAAGGDLRLRRRGQRTVAA
jgi:hypothetical protein